MRKADGVEEISQQNKYSKPFGNKKKSNNGTAPTSQKPAGKIPKWKLQSLQFRQAMGASKPADENGMDEGGYRGGSSNFNPSMQMSAEAETYDDRTQCKYCNRKFNDEAAKRHIPICEGKYKANAMKGGVRSQRKPRV